MRFGGPGAGGWEGRSCPSVLSCGTRAAFPGGAVIAAKAPSASRGVEERSTAEAPDGVAKSKALIQTDLAPKLSAHKLRGPGQVISTCKQSEPPFPHRSKEDDGSSFVRSGLSETMNVGVPGP